MCLTPRWYLLWFLKIFVDIKSRNLSFAFEKYHLNSTPFDSVHLYLMFYLFILNGRLNIKINKDTPTHHYPWSKSCTFVWIQKVSAQFEQTPICIPRPARADQLQLPVTPVTAVYAHLQVYVHERAQWAQWAQSAELIHFVHPNEHQHRPGDYSCCCS